MKLKMFVFSILFGGIVLTGCGTSENAENPDRTLNGDGSLNEFQQPTQLDPEQEMSSQLGYVRYNKAELDMDEENNNVVRMDRKQYADTISRLILRNDGFEEVATLVTDDEVLIAYSQPDEVDREKAASIARQTAYSVIPRFFHVYVSDKPVSFRDIQSLQNSSTLSDDYDKTLESIIEDMKQAPQGEEYINKNQNKDDKEHEQYE
ncbi:YhcN/YlaJ family sporulation lipoprotein [Radiobacillus kanasensis]|uniref:YhcN/YlaJ family sporulation lipoprotein n=1 Tax=Radiobacillus kanasensis TaxID=2844358 RepID=UPI001E45D217|nr:YhcN/YlaJ family sporulation lipoprotein [Radiobacillus kanasensis]UFT98233.1 YhcN/YlaJ family sporulation lipoprotein [Radiobacillus kanasensis]